ncbi:MAG: glutathione-binding protein gsiB [Pseudomonadota bacterium]|jgi:peptide/nickel transport system substrate-binding protein
MQHQLGHVLQSKPCAARTASLTLLLTLVVASALCACDRNASAQRPAGLAVLLPRDAQQLDPRFVGDAYGHKLSRLIFASLMRIDPQTLEPVPDLARSVRMLSDTEYRVELRPNLRFSDGSVLDADDVVATFRSVVDPTLHTRYASTYERIQEVKAIDANTITFRLNGPHASFLSDLEMPILRAEDAHRRLSLEANTPVGAGPYVLAERHPGGLELVPNPHWYEGTPRVPRIRMLVVRDDNTRALRLLSGAADYTLNGVPAGLLPLFTPAKGFAVETASGIGTTYLGINTRAPGLSDVRVRQALALAIDRRSLIAAKLSGRAELASSFVPNGHWAYAADTPSYAFDPARARALLAAAQLGGPRNAADKSAAPRVHWVLRCSSERYRVSIARAVAAMLADVGIAVRVQPSETATLLADLDRGHFELTLLQFPELIEPHVLSWVFASERIPGPGREGLNRWRYADPELDAALERGRRSSDRETRKLAYKDVQRRLAEQLPVVPLWHEAVVAVRAQSAPAIGVPRDGRFTTLAR